MLTAILWMQWLLATADGVVSGTDTNFFVTLPISPTLLTTNNFFVGFMMPAGPGSGVIHFPGSLDKSAPSFTNRSFYGWGAAGAGNIYNLGANQSPPEAIDAGGLTGNWLIGRTRFPSRAPMHSLVSARFFARWLASAGPTLSHLERSEALRGPDFWVRQSRGECSDAALSA